MKLCLLIIDYILRILFQYIIMNAFCDMNLHNDEDPSNTFHYNLIEVNNFLYLFWQVIYY